MFSFENIYRQYLLCRRNKRNTINALRFEVRHEQNLLELKEELETRTYKPSRSVCFFATLSSYLGHFKMADTCNLCKSL